MRNRMRKIGVALIVLGALLLFVEVHSGADSCGSIVFPKHVVAGGCGDKRAPVGAVAVGTIVIGLAVGTLGPRQPRNSQPPSSPSSRSTT